MQTIKWLTFGTIILCSFLLSSCSNSLKYFNQNMVNEYRWSKEEIKKIQFYLSEDIVLWRKLRDEDTVIKNGKIRIEDDSQVEEVVIKKNTPGVVLFVPKTNKFAVSFDDEDHFLMFGPNPKNRNKYVLLAKDWNRRIGKVTYGDAIYSTDSDSAFAALMVDIKKAKRVKYDSKTASGRRVRN